MKKIKISFLLFLLIFAVGCSQKKISSFSDYEELLKSEPIQEELDDEKEVDLKDNFSATKLYSYKISARVLAKKDYSDKLSEAVPIDLALGWNKMSNLDLLEQSKIKISQNNRFYFWQVPSFSPLNRKEIEHNSANVHIVPSSEKIKNYFEGEVEEGDNVYMEGFLVNLNHKGGDPSLFRKTSTKRTDTGPGACEIFYVTKVVHIKE